MGEGELNMKKVKLVEKTWDELVEADELQRASGYSFELLCEGVDEVKEWTNASYRYCPILKAWRWQEGEQLKDWEKKIKDWRFGVYVRFDGRIVHSSGLIYKSFIEAIKTLPGVSADIAWGRDLEGSEELVAPFLFYGAKKH